MSQYVAVNDGTGPLYDELRKLFHADYEPTRVHDFFAALPKRLAATAREREPRRLPADRHDELRRPARASLRTAGEPYDVVWYIADGEHAASSGIAPTVASRGRSTGPRTTTSIDLEQRTVILKIHGAVDRLVPSATAT